MPRVHTHTTQYQPTAAFMGTDGYSHAPAAFISVNISYRPSCFAFISHAILFTSSAQVFLWILAPETWRDFLLQFLFLEPQSIDCHWWTYSLFSLSGKYAFICTSVNHKVYDADHASTSYKYQACTFGYRFIRYLINTYISPRYIDGSPKELTRLATQLTGRLSIHKAEFRTLTHSRQMNNGTTHKRFRSLTAEMVMAFYQIITPGSISKKNPLNPFPAGEIQLRNFLICRLLLNYGLRVSELLLLECHSIKPNLEGISSAWLWPQ